MAVRAHADSVDVAPSDVARAFGARVSIPMEGSALFLVIGRRQAPDAIVQQCGGYVVTHLPDPRQVLAVVPLSSWMGLRGDAGIASAGPVNIDQERFARFAELSGMGE